LQNYFSTALDVLTSNALEVLVQLDEYLLLKRVYHFHNRNLMRNPKEGLNGSISKRRKATNVQLFNLPMV